MRTRLVFLVLAIAIPQAGIAQNLPLKNSREETVIGKRIGEEGCGFSVRLRMKPGGPAGMGWQQVGPRKMVGDKCEVRVEIGELDQKDIRRLFSVRREEGYENLSLWGQTQDTTIKKDWQKQLLSQSSCGQARAWVWDPIYIEVNSVVSTLAWTWDPDPNGPGVTFGSGSATFFWNTPTGWRRDFSTFALWDYRPDWMTSEALASFSNHSFCPAGSTYVDYWPVDATGYWDGWFEALMYIEIYGYCVGLLTPNGAAARPCQW